MEKLLNKQGHPKDAYLFALSKVFERSHYYGVRSILILYLIGESIKMSKEDAISLYGSIILSLLISRVFGALFGDLIVNNRNATIIGGILSVIGTFILMIPDLNAIYIGLGFIVLGTGMYEPNLISQFGKLYSDRTKILDAGYSILLIAVNFGGFMGPYYIGRIRGIDNNASYSFLLAGLMMLVSVIILIFIKKKETTTTFKVKLSIDKRVFFSVAVVFFVAIYWMMYSMIGKGQSELFYTVANFINMDTYMINSYYLLPTLIFTVLAVFVWTSFYYNQFVKLIIGFVFATASVYMLLYIPEEMTQIGLSYFVLSLVFMGLAEIHIAPVVLSILTKYTNPKYLAITISLSLSVSYLYYKMADVFMTNDNDLAIYGIAVSVFGISTLLMIVLYYLIKDKETL